MSCSSTLIMFSSVFLVIIIILVGLFVWYTKNNQTKPCETKSCETKSCETKAYETKSTNSPVNRQASPSYSTYPSNPYSNPYSYPTYRNYYPQSLVTPDFLYSRNVYLDNVMNGYYPGYSYTWANGGNRGINNDERVNKNINNISVNVPSGNVPSSGNENKK